LYVERGDVSGVGSGPVELGHEVPVGLPSTFEVVSAASPRTVLLDGAEHAGACVIERWPWYPREAGPIGDGGRIAGQLR